MNSLHPMAIGGSPTSYIAAGRECKGESAEEKANTTFLFILVHTSFPACPVFFPSLSFNHSFHPFMHACFVVWGPRLSRPHGKFKFKIYIHSTRKEGRDGGREEFLCGMIISERALRAIE